MTERLQAVFDTNVFVSAALSENPTSPTRELLLHWEHDEFTVITCTQLAAELVEKLLDHDVIPEKIDRLIALFALAEWVDVPDDAVTPVLPDPDDDIVLACAVLGNANHIVTYDPHFDTLGGAYQGITIVKALPFLWAVRGDKPPELPEPTTDT